MCEEYYDCLLELCFRKKCLKIFRRIFEVIFIILGTILIGLGINFRDIEEGSLGYIIFLAIYYPFFYALYYFPRCCLDSDCLDRKYKCKRNTYIFLAVNGILFIIFFSVLIIWSIAKMSKYKRTK